MGIGLKLGDRVASLISNRVAFVVHCLARIKAALAATPLNFRYQAPEFDRTLEVSDAAVLLAHAERHVDLAKSSLAGMLPLGSLRGESSGDTAFFSLRGTASFLQCPRLPTGTRAALGSAVAS